ncbi:uncharacterized protein TRIADDRAFT_60598 [Trichoplax adhaerens]|uniref:Expressed protein n=1 Tax=Trichoplax adhaerens TaxID=10228 RepID=B3S8N1_TRIAD|nr:expressed protein [Trichoplax adhaerens]EDV20984.1 expressed protein [Trichoplax adhaerens]|eukprot:XP_002116628.1 expressed protein [Trichoplax adhaerens]
MANYESKIVPLTLTANDEPAIVQLTVQEFEDTLREIGNGYQYYYIGIAEFHDDLKTSLKTRGIGDGHHCDEKMGKKPRVIYGTGKLTKERGCQLELKSIEEHRKNKYCLNEKSSSETTATHVVCYIRVYNSQSSKPIETDRSYNFQPEKYPSYCERL